MGCYFNFAIAGIRDIRVCQIVLEFLNHGFGGSKDSRIRFRPIGSRAKPTEDPARRCGHQTSPRIWQQN